MREPSDCLRLKVWLTHQFLPGNNKHLGKKEPWTGKASTCHQLNKMRLVLGPPLPHPGNKALNYLELPATYIKSLYWGTEKIVKSSKVANYP